MERKSTLNNILLPNQWTALGMAIVCFCILLFFTRFLLNSHPIAIHAWAQSDYYAMAQKFYLSTWNLFAPETWILNKQFPSNWAVIGNDAITGGNISLHPYLVGMIMRIVDNDAPSIYRLYCLLWTLPMFYYFFRICHLLKTNFGIQLILGSIIVLSPAFIYYAVGFINTVPCLAQLIAGVYFYLKFVQSGNKKDWWICLAILGTLPLIRTTYLVALIAVFCNEGLRWMCKDITFKILVNRVLTVLPFFILIGVWFIWNKKMSAKHDTIFLNHLMFANSISEAKEIIYSSFELWKEHYFNRYHFWVMAVIVCIGVIFNRKKWMNFNMSFVLILSFGFLLFSVALLKQFYNHDYYFLDTFFIPIILLLLVLVGDAFSQKYMHWVGIIIGVLLFGFSYPLSRDYLGWRTNLETWDPYLHLSTAYKGIEPFLLENGIAKETEVFVLSNTAPNRNLTFIKRNGVLTSKHEEVLFKAADQQRFQHFFIVKGELESYYPSVLVYLKPKAIYGTEVLLLERNDSEPLSLSDFMNYK